MWVERRVNSKDGKKRALKRNIKKAEKWKGGNKMKETNSNIIYLNQCGWTKLHLEDRDLLVPFKTNPAIWYMQKIQLNQKGIELLK